MIEITQKHKDVFYAKICPYCGSNTKRISETEVYGREYSGRDVIACCNFPTCDSYVGCHSTGEPLGRLANKELRKYKKIAHDYFDRLWKGKKLKRGEAYKMLSEYLGIPKEFTHIGMFGVKTCRKVVKFSTEQILND